MASTSKKKKPDDEKQEAAEEKDDHSYTPPEVPKIKLNNEKEIPIIGISTKKFKSNCKELVGDAIKLGYRHFDCAEVDGNENDIGATFKDYIRKGFIKRSDLYVTSKLWNTHHSPHLVRKACEKSLKNLGLSYLDCYVMHSPMAFKDGDDYYPKDEEGKIIFSDLDFIHTWTAMEKLVQSGLVISIGLANFNIRQMNFLMEKTRIKPAVLHVESHPYFNQQLLMDFCATNDIVVVANFCFASPSHIYRVHSKIPLLFNKKIQEIARKAKITPAQVLMRYQIQRGNVVVVTALKRSHMKEDLMSVTCHIDSEAISEIDELETGTRVNELEEYRGHPNHPYEKDLL